jgi:hypothetical protein
MMWVNIIVACDRGHPVPLLCDLVRNCRINVFPSIHVSSMLSAHSA